MDTTPVENMHDFLQKYGTMTPGIMVAEYIRRAPEFPGDNELASALGVLMADLKTALEHVR